jgi:hypothetical protein
VGPTRSLIHIPKFGQEILSQMDFIVEKSIGLELIVISENEK